MKLGTRGYMGTFGLAASTSSGSFGALSVFRNFGLMIKDGKNTFSGHNS